MIEDIGEARRRLLALIGVAGSVVAFTGAGISTECGVPDFRSPDSAWRRYPPIGFQAFVSSPAARVEAWRRKFAMDDLYAGAKPGRTHHALARLSAAGRIATVVTQNIDGLHQAAGLPERDLIELHGNGTFARCLSCGMRHDLDPIRRDLAATGLAPECACGGMLKSATVAFGQPLAPADLRRSRETALRADLFLVLGSSLVVRPAAALPLIAKQNGAALVIVNLQPTPLDDEADLLIRADVGAVVEF